MLIKTIPRYHFHPSDWQSQQTHRHSMGEGVSKAQACHWGSVSWWQGGGLQITQVRPGPSSSPRSSARCPAVLAMTSKQGGWLDTWGTRGRIPGQGQGRDTRGDALNGPKGRELEMSLQRWQGHLYSVPLGDLLHFEPCWCINGQKLVKTKQSKRKKDSLKSQSQMVDS